MAWTDVADDVLDCAMECATADGLQMLADMSVLLSGVALERRYVTPA